MIANRFPMFVLIVRAESRSYILHTQSTIKKPNAASFGLFEWPVGPLCLFHTSST